LLQHYNNYYLFMSYATKAAQENTNIQTYKTYKKTREANSNLMELFFVARVNGDAIISKEVSTSWG